VACPLYALQWHMSNDVRSHVVDSSSHLSTHEHFVHSKIRSNYCYADFILLLFVCPSVCARAVTVNVVNFI